MSAVVDGVGSVVDGIGDAALSGLRFGQAAISRVADFSLRGAKEGFRLTKSVLSHIPVDKLKVSGANLNVVNKIHLRKLFQKRYGAEIKRSTSDEYCEEDEGFLIDEETEEALSDDKVQERVDKKFFDREYDPVRFELTQLQATWTDLEAGMDMGSEERKSIEDAILDRRHKVGIVGTTLKRRVLDNYTAFVNGIEQIQRVNEDLLSTSASCTDTREKLHAAKDRYVVGGLMIPCLNRRRHHLRALSHVVDAMSDVASRYQRLLQLLEDGHFIDAVVMLSEEVQNPDFARLKGIHVMRPIMAEWDRFISSNMTLMTYVNDSVTETVSSLRNFQELKYRNAVEAARMLGEFEDCVNNVAQSLWGNAIQLLIKSLTEVSSIKDEHGDIAVITAAIASEHLPFATVQLCGKMVDFLVLYNSVCKAHLEELKAPRGGDAADFHKRALEYIKPVGRRIGRDIGEKVCTMLQHAKLGQLDLDKVLHIFFVISMLVEGMSVFGLSKDELASLRSTIKTYVSQYTTVYFLHKKSDAVLSFMVDDTWDVLGDQPLQSQRVVKPLAPELYRSFVKQVKQYVNSDSSSAAQLADNPFYTPTFMTPQDTSVLISLQTVGEWAQQLEVDNATAPLPSPRTFTCVVQSSQVAANLLVECVARIVVRLPPMAAEVIQWCEDVCSLYLLCVGDSFVSCSRDVRLEDQPHFSIEGRRNIRFAREGAARCTSQDTKSQSEFPPRVCDNVNDLSNPQKMFGLGARCVAVEAAQALLVALSAAVHAVAPLLPQSVVEQRKQSVAMLHQLSNEMMQVIMHRMVLANFGSERFVSDLNKLFHSAVKGDMRPSACIDTLVQSVAAFHQRCPSFPSKHMDDLFQLRLVFAIQTIVVQEYAQLVMNPKIEFALMNVNRRKVEDMFVVQLTVDAKAFNERMVDMMPLGSRSLALPNYIKDFLTSAFEQEFDRRIKWIEAHHAWYAASDMANWLCFSSRTKKRQLDEVLTKLNHNDVVPVFSIK